jgi:hypothetical protein
MKYLKIQNDGILDIRLVALMGGTTKSKDEFKIGQFGTGLKYTLAFLYRNNLDFKIFAGTDEMKLHVEKEIIRNDVFEIICINGQRTSITTKMGEDWSAWMIIRELWCNALDEGGANKEVTDVLQGEEGKTTFFIQEDSQIKSVLKDWNKYFIHDQLPVWQNDIYTIYPAGDHLCLYKKGVLIYENKEQKSLFSYDIGNADINELREFKGSVSCEIVYSLLNTSEKVIDYILENISEDHYEGNGMDWNWYSSFSKTWENVIGNAKIITKKTLEELEARGSYPDKSTLIILPKNLYSALSKQFKNISAVYVASEGGSFYEDYNESCENKIKQGLTILEACNYYFRPELQFIYGLFEDKRILAQVNMKEKVIRVSNSMLQKTLACVVSMLIEENEHFVTGMSDNTREFQQHFIDLYTRQLLAQNLIEI